MTTKMTRQEADDHNMRMLVKKLRKPQKLMTTEDREKDQAKRVTDRLFQMFSEQSGVHPHASREFKLRVRAKLGYELTPIEDYPTPESMFKIPCQHPVPCLSEPSLTLHCSSCGAWLKTGSVIEWSCCLEECDWTGRKPEGMNGDDPDPWCPVCGGAAYESEFMYHAVPRAEATRGTDVCPECDIDKRECEHADE